MFKIVKKIVFVFVAVAFAFFSPTGFAFEDEGTEKSSEKTEEQPCEAKVTEENKAKGTEMNEKEFTKAVKKCEKKRQREANKLKCQPTGSRLNRC